MIDLSTIKSAIACKCPRCGQGSLYPSGFNLALNTTCPSCGLDLAKNDSADGPAVFLIFFLGFLLVPLALLLENLVAPPLWVHAVLWGIIAFGITIGLLRPLKAYIIALQYKHRPGDWQ
jgi:uncharacterized protein (DUF983 family)